VLAEFCPEEVSKTLAAFKDRPLRARCRTPCVRLDVKRPVDPKGSAGRIAASAPLISRRIRRIFQIGLKFTI